MSSKAVTLKFKGVLKSYDYADEKKCLMCSGNSSLSWQFSGRMISDIEKAFEGDRIEITIKRVTKKRSSAQDGYYYGGVLPAVIDGMRELGNHVNAANADDRKLVHEYLKDKFKKEEYFERRQWVDIFGEVHEMKPTITTMTPTQMNMYITDVRNWAAELLNIYIEEPNEQGEFWSSLTERLNR